MFSGSDEPIPGWWETRPLTFAEGARVGYLEGFRDALQLAEELYGPWHTFDAAAVVRALEARGRWPVVQSGPGDRQPRA